MGKQEQDRQPVGSMDYQNTVEGYIKPGPGHRCPGDCSEATADQV